MDHDVASELRSPVHFGRPAIEVIGVIQAQGEMEPAIGVQKLQTIDTFRDLAVTFFKLGA